MGEEGGGGPGNPGALRSSDRISSLGFYHAYQLDVGKTPPTKPNHTTIQLGWNPLLTACETFSDTDDLEGPREGSGSMRRRAHPSAAAVHRRTWQREPHDMRECFQMIRVRKTLSRSQSQHVLESVSTFTGRRSNVHRDKTLHRREHFS